MGQPVQFLVPHMVGSPSTAGNDSLAESVTTPEHSRVGPNLPPKEGKTNPRIEINT